MAALNYVFVGLGNAALNFPCREDVTLTELRDRIEQRGVLPSEFSFYHNGNPVSGGQERLDVSDAEVKSGIVMVRAYPRILGGKGGFGALIRSMGMQINKNRSRDACRDLSGRRMRDVNAEKKMAEWMKKDAERKRQKAEERARKRAHLLDEPRHFFNDPQYMQQLEESAENMSESLKQGLQAATTASSSGKKRAIQDEAEPSKKTKLWLGTDESDDLDSGGEEDNGTSSSAGGDRPAAATAQLQQDKERSPVHESSSETKEQDASSPGQETTTTADDTRETAGGENVCEDSSTKCPTGMSTEQGTPTAENARNPTPEPISLEEYHSVEELECLAGDRLKHSLQSMGLKCGGTVRERAQRLFSVKGKQLDEINPSLFAKPSKGKGKGRSKAKAPLT